MLELPAIDRSKVDDIHWNGNKMLSYNKPFNACISPRELGKTTWFWLFAYNTLRNKELTTAVCRRNSIDITDIYISDIGKILNEFLTDKIELVFKRGSIKDGIVDVKLKYKGNTYDFFRVVALSLPVMRLKGMVMPQISILAMDEFIVDTRHGEKYLPGEEFKFKELYNTLNRYAEKRGDTLRAIFLGNPYSHVNPYFSIWWKVPIKELYPGNFYVNDLVAVDIGVMSDELKAMILKSNPLYKFDDTYKAYGFDGRAINDEQIKVREVQPPNFKLIYMFYVDNIKLGVFYNASRDHDDDYFWCKHMPDYTSQNRPTITFDYNSMINGVYLYDKSAKKVFSFLSQAFRKQKISYASPLEAYTFERIYDSF